MNKPAGDEQTPSRNVAPASNERPWVQPADRLLASIIESLPDATFAIDRDKRIVAWNHACEVMTGVQKEALLGKGDYAYAEPFYGERRPILIDLLDLPSPEVEAVYEHVQRKGDVICAETFVQHLRGGQGACLWVEAAPLFDRDGQRCGAIEGVRDITEHKEREAELRKANRALRALSECNKALVRATDEAGLLEAICRVVVDVGGYRLAWVGYKENDEAKSVRPVAQAGYEEGYLETLRITWADSERGRGPTGVAIRTGRAVSARDTRSDPEFGPWRADALKRGYASSLVLPLLADGEAFGALNIYSIATDAFNAHEVALLTGLADDLAFGILGHRMRVERQRTEEALRASEREYRELVVLANSIILRWSRDGRITFLNEFGQRFFGYTLEEIVGRHVLGTIVPESESTGRDLRPLMDEVCANPKRFERNSNENIRRNGDRVWIDWTNKVVLDGQGQIQEILSIGSDITERKRSEEQVQRLNQELRRHAEDLEQRVLARTAQLAARNEELKDFSYTVSHDLKAPLRGIAGYANELDRKHRAGLSDRAHFCLTQILTATSHLDQLIEELLRYSRLDAEMPSPTAVNLGSLVEMILRDRDLAITEQHVEVTVDIPFATVQTWERGLVQVLSNLIDNAIKYSRNANPPRLRIAATSLDGAWRVAVSDNGIGFDMKYHDRIFKLFNRLVRMEEFEGTGAGLAIARRVVEKLGGRIWAESAPGQGATFFVELQKPGEGA